MKKTAAIAIICLLMLTGCFETALIPEGESDASQNTTSDVELNSTQLEDDLSKLNELTALQQKQIEVLQEEIERLSNVVKSKADRELVQSERQNITIWRHLLLASDVVEVINGFVQEVEELDGQIIIQVQYAEWLGGEEAIAAAMEETNLPREEVSVPNNFYIRRHTEDIRQYNLSGHSLSYISEHARSVYLPREQLVDYLLDEDYRAYRLYQFYVVNGEISVIIERYIP